VSEACGPNKPLGCNCEIPMRCAWRRDRSRATKRAASAQGRQLNTSGWLFVTSKYNHRRRGWAWTLAYRGRSNLRSDSRRLYPRGSRHRPSIDTQRQSVCCSVTVCYD
jgi:hypothetical protein